MRLDKGYYQGYIDHVLDEQTDALANSEEDEHGQTEYVIGSSLISINVMLGFVANELHDLNETLKSLRSK